MSRRIRVHLRHTGSSTLRFRVVRLTFGWGWNVDLGRYCLVFRDRHEDPSHYKPKSFFDLGFGRAQLKNQRLRNSMTEEEHIAYDYLRSEGPRQGIRLDYFLKLYRSNNI